MKLEKIPFRKINWEKIKKISVPGEKGKSKYRRATVGEIRTRIVKYSENYLADHWCEKGHIVHCLEGKFTIEIKNGKKYILKKDESCIVGDGIDSHRVISKSGGKLLIID